MSNDEMMITIIPVDKIYSDPSFNCRGRIAPIDVVDLAQDIERNGLQQPIVVQPRRDKDPPEFDYVLVSGHRRHLAHKVNRAKSIPAIVRDNISDLDALRLNLVENLKRKDLTIMQEANAVKHYKDMGLNRDQIAEEINMSPGWVQVRTMLLELPEPIQQAATAGFFSATHIRDLYSLRRAPQRMLDAAKKIKEKKERGEKVGPRILSEKKPSTQKKIRNKQEMKQMLDHVLDAAGANFATRAIAWCCGAITNKDFHLDIKQWCDEHGKPYTMPTFDDN